MEYRPLGRTGLQVSALAYGASSLGGAFGPIDEAEGIRTVHTALDLGINLIDTSPYYGETRSETVLGRALATVPRDGYYLATKVGRYGVDRFDFSAERVTASVEESLQRLGVEYIDILQCHDIEFRSLQQVVDETLPALRKLQVQGKVRFLGVTGYPLRIFRYVLERTELDLVLSYCRYALHDQSLEGLLPFLEERGVGILNAAPLAMGLLTEREPPAWHPASPELKSACARAAAYCRERGADIAQLALQFAVSNSRIAATVVGTPSPGDIRKNVAWAASAPDPALLAGVLDILSGVTQRTWATGLAENSD